MNRHHKMLIAWFLISGLIVFTAVRQIQVAAAEKLRTHQPLPPPLKTRHALRPVVPPWSGDPVADYVARCAKGMTDKEIGWILEDFRSAGLDRFNFTEKTTDDELLAYRVAQNLWYRDSLVDGLRLDRQQSKQLTASQVTQLEKLKAAFIRNRADVEAGKQPSISNSRIDLILSPYWLIGAEPFEIPDYTTFLPWDLCSLTPQQEQITWKKEYLAEQAADTSVEFPPHPLFKYPHPFSSAPELPGVWHLADAIFPLLKGQSITPEEVEVETSGPAILANLRQLHPAQFKIILLVAPNLAGEFQNALDLKIR